MNLLRGIEERLKARLGERDALDREICSLEEAKRLLAPYCEEHETAPELVIRNTAVTNNGESWLPKTQAVSLLGMSDRSFDTFVKEGKIERRQGTGNGRGNGRFVYRRNDVERIALMRKEVVTRRTSAGMG